MNARQTAQANADGGDPIWISYGTIDILKTKPLILLLKDYLTNSAE